jgi:hypothetical protein
VSVSSVRSPASDVIVFDQISLLSQRTPSPIHTHSHHQTSSSTRKSLMQTSMAHFYIRIGSVSPEVQRILGTKLEQIDQELDRYISTQPAHPGEVSVWIHCLTLLISLSPLRLPRYPLKASI